MSTHNVYLPDGLGERAKAAGLNLSGLLRAAVEQELSQMEALKNIDEDIYEVPVETDTGHRVTGRITGKYIGEDSSGDQWYLTSDGRLLMWKESTRTVTGDLLDDPDFDVNDIEDTDLRLQVAVAIGQTPIIDL